MRIDQTLFFFGVLSRVFSFNDPFVPIHALEGGQNPLARTEDLAFERWLDQEQSIALDRLLANVAPGGRNMEGMVPGVVIASPSREHPDYYYQWIRDAAITISTLVRLYAEDPNPAEAPNLPKILRAYASQQHNLQQSSNPSGGFFTGGLGEPKFHTDGSAFTDSWGRPQRDGPALRALTLIRYLRVYNDTNPALWSSGDPDVTHFFKLLYDASLPAISIIKADLEYISNHWKHAGFDLWEEVQGLHFFTAMVQLRALSEGKEIARCFGDRGAAMWYAKQQENMEAFLKQFWDERKGHLVATLGTPRSGLDCAILLGSIHGNPDADGDAEKLPLAYPPWSDEVLLSLLDLVKDQRNRFPINTQASYSSDMLEGVGIGRYPEDVYDGDGTSRGNPWFLCTASASEVLYRSLSYFARQGFLHVSGRGLRFWTAVNPEQISSPGNYSIQNPVLNSTLVRLKLISDGFLKALKRHVDTAGGMSEQFDGITGFERGARDLTWSYGAFLEAVNARRNAERVLATR
ncbi:hypothetical protein FGG08_000401 [Glutinoglossum americanum]|uniref:glucan 1,4-alpha-glucosidase n=1 Tax=Glutinoglossum americanum TaxID=1670608 RepID=A0A9P8IDC3_9PEZI|nr:hypothetical protein FGG08_000401 [Glutinoglossum americanum]